MKTSKIFTEQKRKFNNHMKKFRTQYDYSTFNKLDNKRRNEIHDIVSAIDYLLLVDTEQFKNNHMFQRVKLEHYEIEQEDINLIYHIAENHKVFKKAPESLDWKFCTAIINMLRFWKYQKNYLESYNGK